MRYAARKDANQQEIVEVLRRHGAYVWDLGLPVDLLVGYRGETILMEIKDGKKKKLTGLQERFFDDWPGALLVRVNGTEDALAFLEAIDVVKEQGQAYQGRSGSH
jgi:hypothetical protein